MVSAKCEERASQGEQNDANFSLIANLSKELWVWIPDPIQMYTSLKGRHTDLLRIRTPFLHNRQEKRNKFGVLIASDSDSISANLWHLSFGVLPSYA